MSMRKCLRGLALAAGLTVAAAGTANAQWTWSGCGGQADKFNTCASVDITFSGSSLTMVVQNWGNYDPATNSFASVSGSSIFTQIGLLNGGFGGTLTGLTSFSCLNDATCGWEFDSSLSSLNGYAGGARCTGQGCNADSGLNPPGTPGANTYTQVTLVFSTSGTIDLTNADFALHGQAGPGDCSTKLFVDRTGATYTPNQADPALTTCAGVFNPPTETPVPEPASMVLLATGLVAMGGVGIIRRRRNQKV